LSNGQKVDVGVPRAAACEIAWRSFENEILFRRVKKRPAKQ